MISLPDKPTPMRHHQHSWNLRRIFGRQTVVCVGSPKWPESGIPARVIPDQPSSWTFHGRDVGNSPTCRLADLPTCRLADLPTCRRADVVVDDRWDSGPLTLLQPQLRRFVGIQDQFRGFRLKPCLQNTISFPKICQPSKSLLQWHSLTSSFTRLIF
jgi:hypothetical protein